MQLKLHASEIPLLVACPASRGEHSPGTSEAAAVGSAVHAALEVMVSAETKGSAYNPDDLARLVSQLHDCEQSVDRVTFLFYQGLKIWQKISPTLREINTEVHSQHSLNIDLSLEGTADVFALSGDVPVILDWKSGVEKDYRMQLYAYAWLFGDELLRRPAAERKATTIKVITAWLQTGEYEVEELDEMALRLFGKRVAEAVARIGEFNVGEHCEFCAKRNSHCTAGRAAIARGAEAILSLMKNDGRYGNECPPVRYLGDLYIQSRLLKGALEDYERALNFALQSGPLSLGDGRELAVTEEVREEILWAQAREVIEPETRQTIEKKLLVPKGLLADEIKECAPKRGKALAVRRALEQIRAAGGAREKKYWKRVVRKEKTKGELPHEN